MSASAVIISWIVCMFISAIICLIADGKHLVETGGKYFDGRDRPSSSLCILSGPIFIFLYTTISIFDFLFNFFSKKEWSRLYTKTCYAIASKLWPKKYATVVVKDIIE